MSREHSSSPLKTAKGTELPLLDLKGKPYLQVAHRLVWFREEYPQGRITTSIVKLTDDSCVVKAEILIPVANTGWFELASAHKQETESNFPDFIEKAETGAVGRALGMCGFGTQFAPEFDEGDRLADSPITPAKFSPAKQVVAIARQAGKTEALREAAKPSEETPKAKDPRESMIRLIKSTSEVYLAKRKVSVDQLKEEIKTMFGTDDWKTLPVNKLTELKQTLDSRIKE